MFHHEDPFNATWYNINSPPASVQSPVCEFTFDDTHHIDQPYPSPAESEPFDDSQYTTEQTFDFNHPLAQPLPDSQDYDDKHTLADEINEVLCLSDPTHPTPIPIEYIKREYEPEDKYDVLMHDIMLCHTQTIPMAMITTTTDSQDIVYSVRPDDVIYPEPQIVIQTELEPAINQAPAQMDTETINYLDKSTQKIAVEHNYTNQPENNPDLLKGNAPNTPDDVATIEKFLLRPEQLSRRRRLQPLKLQINPPALNDERCLTADIISDTLDMEIEKSFDLIKFIDAPEEKAKLPESESAQPEPVNMPDVAEIANRKRPAAKMLKIEDLEAMIPTPSATPMKRSRQSSVFSEDSCSTSSSTFTPKRRGRPPKTESTVLSPTVYKHLSETDRRYLEMRNKNNEASRRSRQNRKGKETKVMTEAMKMEMKNMELMTQLHELNREREIWRRAVLRMAKL